MRWMLPVLAGATMLAGPAAAQTDPRVCDEPNGYVEVFEQFIIAWNDARVAGTLVDPELTDTAVWVVAYQNRMVAGEPVAKLCREMIELRAGSSFAAR